MNDGDVLFPWEREGGDRDATAPDADVVDADATGGAADGRDGGAAVAPDAFDAVTDAPVAASGEAATGVEPHPTQADAPEAVEPDASAAAEADADAVAAASQADPSRADDGGTTGESGGAEDDEARFAALDTEYARKAAERASAALREKPIAQKEYYSISEVCELVDLKPHVLRYWETQFQVLNPSKNRSGNRVYQRKEIRLIMLVKHLLYEEKYTVEGAKAKLDRLRRGGELAETAGVVLDRSMIEQLRADLGELTTLLTPPARS